MKTMHIDCIAALAAATCVTLAPGDAVATVAAPAGASIPVTVQISITHSTYGTSSDTETRTHTLAGNLVARLAPGATGATSAQIQSMHLDLGPATYSFAFFCIPIFGCQASLGVNLADLQIDLTAPVISPVGAGGNVTYPSAPLRVQMNYVTSGIDTGTYFFDSPVSSTLTGRFVTAGATTSFDQFTVQTIHFDVPTASLPPSVSAIGLNVSPSFTGVVFSGPWAAIIPGDFNSDGHVDGGDLSVLLSGWGATGVTDLDSSGATDGGDLAVMLSHWG